MEKGRGGIVELKPKKYNKKQKTTLHEKAKVKTRPKEEAKPEQDNVRQCTQTQYPKSIKVNNRKLDPKRMKT